MFLLQYNMSLDTRCKVRVCGHSFAGTVGSNSDGGTDVCLWWVLCVIRQRSLQWMSVSGECCVSSGRGLCNGPIPFPEES